MKNIAQSERHKGACQDRHIGAEGTSRHRDAGKGGTAKAIAFLSYFLILAVVLIFGSTIMTAIDNSLVEIKSSQFIPGESGDAEIISMDSSTNIARVKFSESGNYADIELTQAQFDRSEVGTSGQATSKNRINITYFDGDKIQEFTKYDVGDSAKEKAEDNEGKRVNMLIFGLML